MDEVESMWMEMVVFRIDLMNSWMFRDMQDVSGFDWVELSTHEQCKERKVLYSSSPIRVGGYLWLRIENE